jgi:biopolymer transport protein ExbD
MSSRRKAEDGPEPTLPVTPMLDMAFQLLAFFIISYHPSDLEGQMQLALPANDAKQAHKLEDVKQDSKADKDPTQEVESDLTVIVRTANDPTNVGEISNMVVEDRAGPTPVDNLEALKTYLTKAKANPDSKAAIKVQGDSRLKWSRMVEVMDVCRRAGFDSISFVPPPDLNVSNQ